MNIGRFWNKHRGGGRAKGFWAKIGKMEGKPSSLSEWAKVRWQAKDHETGEQKPEKKKNQGRHRKRQSTQEGRKRGRRGRC